MLSDFSLSIGRLGRKALSLAALVLLGCAVVEAAGTPTPVKRKPYSHPYLKSWYDGTRNLPLGASSVGTLTEMDLFLFRLMRREKDPAIFHTWEECKRPRQRERLSKQLEQAVRELALTLTLAKRGPDRAPSPTEEKFIRYLKYPAYHLVWIEKVLRPSLQIEQIDLVKYYHDHADDFYKPESVRVRYIFRQVPESASAAERRAFESEMEGLRQRILRGEDFVELAREESDAPSAVRGGELPVVARGTLVEEFESQAFALEPGQLSPVFWGPGGLYLVQCLEKFPERQQRFDEVREELAREVERKTLRFLYDYRLRQLLRRRNYSAPYARFVGMSFDDPMLIIGDYRLTKREFIDIFPYVLNEPLELDRVKMTAICREILRGELVARQVERLGLAGDPLLVKADWLARQFWRSQQALRSVLAGPIKLDESEVRRYFEANRKQLGYQPQWRVLRIEASVRNPYLRHPTQIVALRKELRSRLEQTLREFRTAFVEERSREAEQMALAGELSFVPATTAQLPEDRSTTASVRLYRRLMALPRSLRVVTDASTSDYEFTVTDLGFCSVEDKLIYRYVKGLREGQYSEIKTTPEGGLFCYFVERYIPGAEARYEKIRTHVRQELIKAKQMEKVLRLRAQLMRDSALRIRLPELGTKEQ